MSADAEAATGRELAMTNAAYLTALVSATAAIAAAALHARAWWVRIPLVAYAAQLSNLAHELAHAAVIGFGDSEIFVPPRFWAPFAGFGAGLRTRQYAYASIAKQRAIAHAGFQAQFAYCLAVATIVFGPRWWVLAASAFGTLAYMFVYPWIVPRSASDFREW